MAEGTTSGADEAGAPTTPAARPATATATVPMRRRSRFGLRHLMVAIVGFALVFWLIQNAGLLLVVVALIMLPVSLVVAGVVILVRRRATQQEGLLWVLSMAARRQMPLSPGIEAYADLCSIGFRARALLLARMLDSGVSLPEALYRLPDILPRDAALQAYVGWRAGTLGSALREALASRLARQPYRRGVASRLAYLIWVLITMQSIIGFFFYFIMPKFEAIFMDFGVELPAITRFTITVVGKGWLAPAVLLGYLMELALLLYLPLSYFGYLGSGLPGLELLSRRRQTATILRALGSCAEGGRPIAEGVATLARYFPSWLIRGRLTRVYEDIQLGQDWVRSLLARGLIRGSDAVVLDSAQRLGNLAWAFRDLADGIDRRLDYRRLALVQWLFPVFVLALGALVLLISVACFLPLVTLTQELTRWI